MSLSTVYKIKSNAYNSPRKMCLVTMICFYFSRSRGRKGKVATLRAHKNKIKIPQKLNLVGFLLLEQKRERQHQRGATLNKKHGSATLLRPGDFFFFFSFFAACRSKQQSASFTHVVRRVPPGLGCRQERLRPSALQRGPSAPRRRPSALACGASLLIYDGVWSEVSVFFVA